MVSANMEDYLLAVYRLNKEGGAAKTTDIAEALNVSPASVTEMVKRMSEEGLVDYERYRGANLTRKGYRHAHRMHRKHRLVEKFLVEVLGSDVDSAHSSACSIEHNFSDDAARKLCRIIGSPDECDCEELCEDLCVNRKLGGTSLSELKGGESACISHLICDSPEKVRKLIAMGLVPGRVVRVEGGMPLRGPMVVKVEDSLVALDREYTSLVMVDKEG